MQGWLLLQLQLHPHTGRRVTVRLLRFECRRRCPRHHLDSRLRLGLIATVTVPASITVQSDATPYRGCPWRRRRRDRQRRHRQLLHRRHRVLLPRYTVSRFTPTAATINGSTTVASVHLRRVLSRRRCVRA